MLNCQSSSHTHLAFLQLAQDMGDVIVADLNREAAVLRSVVATRPGKSSELSTRMMDDGERRKRD